jgi:hypothetical protein
LHEHTIVSILTFMTRLMTIKSKFTFLNLINDVIPMNHKMLKDMYQSKKLFSTLGTEYEKIDVCKDYCLFFYKEHKI